jgi:dUTP pyrophosphatase
MIIPGHSLLARNIITGLKSATHQVQPCGVDLTLRRVLRWTTPGVIDFDNSHRKTADTVEVAFTETSASLPSPPQSPHCNGTTKRVHLDPGAYLVEFNEKVCISLNDFQNELMRGLIIESWLLG